MVWGLPVLGQAPLSLQDAIAQAERTNPRLQAVKAQQDAVSARAQAVAGMLSPQVSVSGWLAQGTVENMLASSPGVMPDSMRMAQREGFSSAQVKLVLPLFTGGRLQAMVGSARREVAFMSAEVQEMVQDVRLEVAERYLQALLRHQLVGVAEQRLQAQAEQTRIIQAMYEVGKVPLAYLLRSRAAEAEAKQMWTTARNDFRKSLLDLQVSMGISPTGDVDLPLDLQEPTFRLPGDVDEAVQCALQRRALLQAHRHRLGMRQLERRAAQGVLMPQTYLTVSGDWTKAQGMSAESGYTVALVLSMPLWTGRQLEARVREADSRAREQQANLRALQLQVENEVRQAWLDIGTAKTNLATAEAVLQDAEEAYRIAVLRVNEGKAPLVEQIDALAALTDARTRFFHVRTEYLLARTRLLRAIGDL